MKIYHTETQADYDALLIHLKELGYKYIHGSEFSEERPYVIVWWTDMVMRSYQDLMEDEEFKSLPITKYKAKANEMKPTNGTSYKSKDRPKFKIWDNEKNEWYKPTYEAYNGKVEDLSLSPGGDLTMRTLSESSHESTFPDRFEVVMEMPKVVVPKFVAEWIKSYFDEGGTLTDMLDSLTMPYAPVVDVELLRWFKKNTELMLKALVDGYEVEKEQLYRIELPAYDFDMTEKINQPYSIFLGQNIETGSTAHYVAPKPHTEIKMLFNESEIKAIDERYWAFAVKVDETK